MKRVICAATIILGSLQGTHAAIVLVVSENGTRGINYSYIVNSPSIADGTEVTMTACKKQAIAGKFKDKCRIVIASEGPGYLAVVEGKKGIGFDMGPDRQAIIDSAYTACTSVSKNCQPNAAVIQFDGGPDHIAEPSTPQPQQQVQQTYTSSRPMTKRERLNAMDTLKFRSRMGLQSAAPY